jgi:ParB family transcriptional regulator, chromosome partitioning protein
MTDNDPNTLAIATNIRDVAALDDQFVASVAEHSVLTPVTAGRRGDTVEVTGVPQRHPRV